MDTFTPVSALAGGVLIGASAALLLILNGRIAGISGVLGGLLQPTRSDLGWRVAFIAGLLSAPVLYAMFGGTLPPVILKTPTALLVVAGLAVGFGTRLGGGCTSGHGVCGIGRASPRSLAATGVFMTVAILTVFIMRHVLGV
ncbi:MAG: YeeE/YedE family protein [Hyphomicrobiaceae bacterium]